VELSSLQKNVILVSSGQPSLNPRLVKEADALAKAGYEVTVLYAYWNNWGTQHDKQLLAEKKWKAVRASGDPEQKPLTYFFSRLINKISKYLIQKTGNYNYFADLAIARSSYFLIREAKKYNADIYIAHNLGALPAAMKAATKYKKISGFDAEDFHRQEVSDNINSFQFKISKYIEDKYLPLVNYITASAPLIAGRYASLYNKKATCILNVFPKSSGINIIENKKEPLKLFWFSQTIGPNRGLETVIEAMALTKQKVQLHLFGQLADGYQQQLLQIAQAGALDNSQIFFYAPVTANQLFNVAAQFDIGLASEEAELCLNRNISLTNKIFTYLQSGLAITASNTMAQSTFIRQYPQTGRIYSNAQELSLILTGYNQNRELLYQTKEEALKIGQTQLNWETESKKFLNVIENVLTNLLADAN
jgi:glycosyltransferase involved in cell wall biosynthesis